MITVIDGNPNHGTVTLNIEDANDLDILLNSGEYDKNIMNGSTAQYFDKTTGDLRVFYFNNGWGEI